MKVAAGGATETKIDATGIESFECAELFRDDEGRVVGEHDAAAADPDGFCCPGDVADESGGGCGAGKTFNGVMFSKPETAIAPLLSVLREVDGARDGAGGRFVGTHADEVEHGDGKAHRNWM